ncbi:short-chain dehydrogenase [Leifsonia xyli]|uniref:oxidoreductase n=1 Tax=Leifsonia xyli TaxID=1575 RepID=UPI0007CE07BF|nr:short-chain dehydrogenase [Leifsonia xyli]
MADYSASSLPDLTDRTAIVTGASSGIGRATARALAAAGAHVVLAVRDEAKGRAVADGIPGSTEVRPLDLGDLSSVQRFAADWTGPIHVLINNAGVYARALTRTADGFELDLGTNHLGHFALTTLLLPHVTGRVVTLASQAERMGRLDLGDLNWERRPYDPARAYNDSKLANLLFTAELDRRLRGRGSAVRAVAAHPGLVTTAIYDAPAGSRRNLFDRLLPHLGQDAEHGALPALYAATEEVPGGAFVGPQHLLHMRGGAQPISRSARASDPDLAGRLWQASEVMTGVALRS